MTAERLASLKEQHAKADEELALEMNRPHPDTTRIAELKRKKLLLKDEIESLL